ncbi:UNVERIFIED_CONTAM: hypothetical protein Slati_1044700 [Sesamum latifolium]|uniref:Uncharacterized protein n=1 Tax=Sesamum latifolium TaxID=2727402 RepID=A0AAW2XU11_9LAMI
MQIALSRFNPLIYAPFRLSILETMCYAAGSLESLYVLPVYGLAIIPPICLLYGIPLYPKVTDPYFIVFAFIFLAARLKHVQETIAFGDPLRNTVYELRVWMMKSVACYFYAVLNGILDRLGLREANFSLTSKVVDDEQETRFKQGIYDFQPLSSESQGSFRKRRVVGTSRSLLLRGNRELPFAGRYVLEEGQGPDCTVCYSALYHSFRNHPGLRISPSLLLIETMLASFILYYWNWKYNYYTSKSRLVFLKHQFLHELLY